MKVFERIIDKYLAYPILVDIMIGSLTWYASKNIEIFDFILSDRSNQIDILPYIISADVSLAGFVLAALTIIVTFKSNIQSRGMNNASNALELIFSSKHYLRIVQVFRKSLVELVMCFFFLFSAWLSVDNFSINTINRINVFGLIITTLAISRSLFILFVVMDSENYKRNND